MISCSPLWYIYCYRAYCWRSKHCSQSTILVWHAIIFPLQSSGQLVANSISQGTPFPRELLQIVSVSSPDWTCITNIHTAVTFSTKGLAGSTQRSYQAGQKRYLAFCSEVHRPALPTSEATLSMFVSYLAHEGLAHSTIKVDLSAIRNLHVSAGLHEEFSNQLTPRLELVLRGIKKDKAESAPEQVRLPITIEIMHKIKRVLQCRPQDNDNILHALGGMLPSLFWLFKVWGIYSAFTRNVWSGCTLITERHSNW